MKLKRMVVMLVAGWVAFFATSALAQLRDPQVAIGGSSEPTLQSILSGMSGFETVSAASDQQAAQLWSLDNLDVPNGIVAKIVVENAGNAGTNQLGIYSGSNEMTVFNGAAGAGKLATIEWDTLTSGVVTASSGCGTEIFCGSFSGISAAAFGFFLNGVDGKLYSEDSRNGGAAMMLAYKGTTPNDWAFGFEDTRFGDKDYQDMAFRVTDLVSAVPEPEIYAMLFAGLGLMGFVARRRKSQFEFAAV